MKTYHAVAVLTGATCCKAAAGLRGRNLLSSEAPNLPLAECTMPGQCKCRFQKHADRRSGDDDRRLLGSTERTHFYDATAALLKCHRDEVAFIENATRAWDMAFYSLRFNAGDRILTSVSEYASNFISYLHTAKRTGAIVDVVPDDETGQIDVAALERMTDGCTRLIAITHVPSHNGMVRRPRRSAKWRAPPACPICSTPASRQGRCRSMSRSSAATCFPAPVANTCADRAARASSMCAKV